MRVHGDRYQFALAGRRDRGHSPVVPRFRITRVIESQDITATRAVCDGCDPARPCDEHTRQASLWLVTAGAFELRDRDGAHVLDPTHALVMPAGHAFVIRHPAGPDTCVSFRGSLIDRLAERGPRLVALEAAESSRLVAELARRGKQGFGSQEAGGQEAGGQEAGGQEAGGQEAGGQEIDELAIAEALAALDRPGEPTRPDRALAAAVAHELRLGFAQPTSLAELGERIGYSIFHVCRVFRSTTGHTIHGFRRELRLRHALARILDGDEPLIEIAAHTGFASQSHLTNLFRARFGVTPAKARTREGVRRLSA